MKDEIVWKEMRINVPVGWEVRLGRDEISLFPSQCRALVEAQGPVDAVYLGIVQGRAEDLNAIVATVMGRRVKQGQPVARATQLAGVPALERVWIDGVSRAVSWFVVHRSIIYEIQWVEPLIRTVGDEDLAITAKALCTIGITLL